MMAAPKDFISTKSFFYILLGFAVLILSANLGLPPLWGSEGRWALIARSMLRSGDLLSPVLGIRDYWDKPLLSYWQILPLSYIDGDVSEFTARFPSVVWAVVMLLLTHDLAKRWYDEQTALVSVGVLVTSYAFVFWGRNAQVDKPYEIFNDEANALDWAIRVGGILITSNNVSDQSWECVVKGNHWHAMIPRKIPLLNDSYKFR